MEKHEFPDQNAPRLSREELMEGLFTEASYGKRFLNYLMDVIAYYAVVFALMLLLALLAEGIGTTPLDQWSTASFYVLSFLCYSAYFIVLEASTGKTLGKLITRTQVISETGRKASLKQIVGRTLARMIPFEPFSFLGGSGWHDSLSSTLVVNDDGLYLADEPPLD